MSEGNMSHEQASNAETPHELARRNEALIKETIVKKFGLLSSELTLLSSDQEGVYFSKEVPNTLCSLVSDEKHGFLYLVTCEVDPVSQELQNCKCDILA